MRDILFRGVLFLALSAILHAQEDENFTPLDLSQMNAHENQPTIADADFKVKRLLQEHATAALKCQHLGVGARPNTDGGCACSHGFVERNGKCLEQKAAISKKAMKVGARLGMDNFDNFPLCESDSACIKVLWDVLDSIDEKQAQCMVTSQHLKDKLYAINQTYQEDVNERQRHLVDIEAWIGKMRDQNQLMVLQLRRYTQVIADGERLGRESEKMNAEQATLSSKVAELSVELDRLRDEKRALEQQLEPQVTQCEERLVALKDGLASRGLRVPS